MTLFSNLKLPAQNTTESSRLYQLQQRLRLDLLSCDALWSLFVAAAHSHRYEDLLIPFPKSFRNSSILHICDIMGDVPRLERLLMRPPSLWPSNVVNLLYAVLVKQADRVCLSSLQTSEFDELYHHLRMPNPRTLPTHIFEVTPSRKCAHAQAYFNQRRMGEYPVRLGFYGGKLEHLYSLLNANTLPLGEPLLLTTDLEEALQLSTPCACWGASRCGSVLRCVAIVEFMHMPQHVNVTSDHRQVYIKEPSCLQVTYLMFYGQSYVKHMASMEQPGQQVLNWMDANKCAVSLGLYMMIMCFVSQPGCSLFQCFANIGLNVFKRGLLKI